MNTRRETLIRQAAALRQLDLAVVLENLEDAHNLGAVMRSCDAVGIQHVVLLQSAPDLAHKNVLLGKRTSAGARKWLDVDFYNDRQACFAMLRQRYGRVLAAHLGEHGTALYGLDLCQPTALLFGNEQRGVSPDTLALCDGHFSIPQVGFISSLNVSVACALSVYEACRQRLAAGRYPDPAAPMDAAHEALLARYLERHAEGQSPFLANNHSEAPLANPPLPRYLKKRLD